MVQDDPETWLDEALAGYSATEPRVGLERRVLERLQAKKQWLPRGWWKAWAPAFAALAAVIVVAVVVVRNRYVSSERLVTPQNTPAQTPAEPSEKAAAESRQEAAGSGSAVRTEESTPQETAEAVQAPETAAASAHAAAGEPASAKAGTGTIRRAKPASNLTPSAHIGRVFPMPAPLSDQERLTLAAVQSGVLPSDRPPIPPGDELLPQVAIREIEIRPLQEIKPIGMEDL